MTDADELTTALLGWAEHLQCGWADSQQVERAMLRWLAEHQEVPA